MLQGKQEKHVCARDQRMRALELQNMTAITDMGVAQEAQEGASGVHRKATEIQNRGTITIITSIQGPEIALEEMLHQR